MISGQNVVQIEKTKVGVIGLGDISTKVHLPILSARKDTEIVWSFDINEENAKYISKIFNLRLISSNTGLIDFPEVDVILMAIPPTQRQTYLEFFLKSNTSFYIEKPFAFSASEHESICKKFAPFRLGNGLQYNLPGNTATLHIIDSDLYFEFDFVSVVSISSKQSGFSHNLYYFIEQSSSSMYAGKINENIYSNISVFI